MVLGLLGPLVSFAMVLALRVLSLLALDVLEMASLISVFDSRATGEAGPRLSCAGKIRSAMARKGLSISDKVIQIRNRYANWNWIMTNSLPA